MFIIKNPGISKRDPNRYNLITCEPKPHVHSTKINGYENGDFRHHLELAFKYLMMIPSLV